MTGHQINSLVGDLVAMAQAMEELPKVKDELHLTQVESVGLLNRIESIQNDLNQARSYAASLEQKVRDAEVAKDQAETMFLEADERAGNAAQLLRNFQQVFGDLVQNTIVDAERALNPPKPEPVPEPSKPNMKELGEEIALTYPGHFEAGVQGQSEPPLPSSTADAPMEHTQSPSVPSPIANGTENASSDHSWAGPASTDTPPAQPAPPYLNRRYIDVPGWVSRQDWINGGGTDADYDYRHEYSKDAGI